MEPLDLAFITRHVHGEHSGTSAITVTGVSTDTRTIRPGDLYVPLTGERFDGHDFISNAAAGGAAAAIISRPVPSPGIPVIRVTDTLKALQNLAAAYRRQFHIPVIAVTGSHGKTTTKDLVAAALPGRVHATFRNLNGLIGVPLTILSLDHTHEFLVIETGISKPGEMDILGDIVRPDMVIFTCAAPAHTEFLHDLTAIITEKSRIFKYMQPGGIRLINGDDDGIAHLADSGKAITFGFHGDPDVRGNILELRPDGSRFTVSIAHEPPREYHLPLPGAFNIANALAAIAAARQFGVAHGDIQAGFDTIQLSPHRCDIREFNGFTIIDDCYNAAPVSMRRSLEMLASLRTGHRVIAVLGDMLELGESSTAAHETIGRTAAELGIDRILTFGNEAAGIAAAAGRAGADASHYATKNALADALTSTVQPGDIILFKASRSMGAETIIQQLTTEERN